MREQIREFTEAAETYVLDVIFQQRPGRKAAALRVAVTSPGGTTERALAVLMASDAWPAALSKAIAAATVRSRELAG
jgi:pyrroline-5-carboxylate reductase